MRKLNLLLRARFTNAYSIKKVLKTEKKKLILYAFLAIYIIFSLAVSVFSFANSLADSLEKYNLISFMLIIFFIISSFTTFMFTFFNAKGSMFNSDDNDLLLSMPIKPSTILASRLIYIYLWNLLTSLFIVMPAIIVYAARVDVTFIYYVLALICFVLLPVVPTVIACVIGYIIGYLTAKSNIKNWFEMIISFTLFVAVYYVMSKANVIIEFISNNISDIETFLKWFFYPLYLINEIFMHHNYLSLLIYVVLNISLFALFTHLLGRNFKKVIVKLQENKTKSNYVMKKLVTSSISKRLYLKELKRYISSPIYVFNTAFGVIMLAAAAIASIFYDKSEILKTMDMSSASMGLFPLLTVGIVFVAFMSNTASASISIEGSNYWILKTLPINAIKILNSKIVLNLILILPVTFVSLIIMYLTGGLKIIELVALIVIATISAITSSQFGLLANLKFPKMDAVNDTVIVKRSASVMISTLAPMAIIFGIVGIYTGIGSSIDINIFILIITILLAVIALIEHYLLMTWGVKRFKEIN